MNIRNDTGFRTFLVGAGGVTRHTRVKLDSGAIVTAGAGEDAIGVALDTVAANGYCAVKTWSAPGTFVITTAGAVTNGAAVYGAANGQVDDTVAGNKIGTALEAATGANQDIEILPAGVGDLFAAAAHVTDAVTLTDNTGYSATHDDTLAATAAITALTDNGGGAAADDTIAAITQAANAGSADVGPVADAIKELSTKVNALITRDAVHAQNVSDVAQKVIELVAKLNTVLANLEANGIHLAA